MPIGEQENGQDISAILKFAVGSGPLEGGGNVTRECTGQFMHKSFILSPNNKSFAEINLDNLNEKDEEEYTDNVEVKLFNDNKAQEDEENE